MVHITKTSLGERAGVNINMVRRKRVRCREYRPITADASQFAQTLPRSVAGRIETIGSLRWHERGVGGPGS